ncbi:MAG: hypothetical protein IPG39_19550 [Bacteroidetes bacterium]|nr:hypothetical protein [Bacteroidota bacterium]
MESDNLTTEYPLLINPFDENPELFIGFDWEDSNGMFVKATSTSLDTSLRGKKTIEIAGLNRSQLLEERAGILLTLEGYAAKMLAR